jgi:hypothetical protein
VIEQSFQRQLDALPVQTRLLLVIAAADPSGDPTLLWRAAARLGIPAQAATPAVQAGQTLAPARPANLDAYDIVRTHGAQYLSAARGPVPVTIVP